MFSLIHIANHSNMDRKEHKLIGVYQTMEEIDTKLDEFRQDYAQEYEYEDDEVEMREIKYNRKQIYDNYHDDVWEIADHQGNPIKYTMITIN
jgi:uncharacterized membrane protein (DUF106 family)